MKLFLATFSMVLILLSCNFNVTHSQVDSISKVEVTNETTTTVEGSKLGITKSLVLGKFDYRTDTTFVKVNAEHSAKPLYLNKTVYTAFLEMYKAAAADGVDLIILSGTRNFVEQKAIWERKWNAYHTLSPNQRARKILEYSSMPTTSRHHWGTDLDLNSLSNSYFSSGKGKATYEWLCTHANDFGFYQVYTDKSSGRAGYNLEKWHWSYLPLASKYLDFYNKSISLDDISGFEGAELANDLNIIEAYVNGISKSAKEYK